MEKIIYKELSYNIIGILFEIYNKLGYGLREKTYQEAIACCLKEIKIKFIREEKAKLKFHNKVLRRIYLDFLIDDKIILEIKVGDYFDKTNIAQVYEYLKAKKLKLGIVANFTRKGIRYKRIIYKVTD